MRSQVRILSPHFRKENQHQVGSLYLHLIMGFDPNTTLPTMNTKDDTYRRIHFAVMAIESGARKLGISGKEMHHRLSKQDLIRKRLIKRYDELHTQSLDWVAADISETLLNWEAGL